MGKDKGVVLRIHLVPARGIPWSSIAAYHAEIDFDPSLPHVGFSFFLARAQITGGLLYAAPVASYKGGAESNARSFAATDYRK
jgi:hypothetical protein